MNKILKAIPYLIMIVSVVFIIYVTAVMQNVENQCNTHLQQRYKTFIEKACSYCAADKSNIGPTTNLTIELPGWLD